MPGHETPHRVSPACKVCGKIAVLIGRIPNQHSATSPLHHFRCVTCGLVFVGDHIEADELGRAYAGLDNASYFDEIKNESDRKLCAAVEDLRRLCSPTSRILDCGTGNGRFIQLLLNAGFRHVDGHDIPSVEDYGSLRQRGSVIYRDFDYSTIPARSYDVVSLMDVAEHVPDPLFLFRSCYRILKGGGIVYLHTPVVTRIDRTMHWMQSVPLLRGIGQTWQRGRTSIFHLQNYTGASLQQALRDTGFSDVSITVRNELSWPVSRYVRVYLCEKLNLSQAWVPLLTPVFRPLLATDTFNANKAIAWALKPHTNASSA